MKFIRPGFIAVAAIPLLLALVSPAVSDGTDEVPEKFGGHVSDVKRIAFSKDGRELRAFGSDRIFISWDYPSGRERYRRRSRVMDDVLFSGDGRSFAALGAAGVVMGDMDTGTIMNRLKRLVDGPAFLNRKGTTLLFTDGRELKWIDTRSGREKAKYAPGPLRSFAVSPDFKQLLLLRTGAAELRSASDFKLTRRFRLRPNTISAILGPAGRLAAFAFADGLVELHDVKTGDVVQARKFPPAYPIQLRFDPGGTYLAIQGHLKLFVWNLKTRKSFAVPTRPLLIRSLAFSPTDSLIACGFRDGYVRVYNLAELEGRKTALRRTAGQ